MQRRGLLSGQSQPLPGSGLLSAAGPPPSRGCRSPGRPTEAVSFSQSHRAAVGLLAGARPRPEKVNPEGARTGPDDERSDNGKQGGEVRHRGRLWHGGVTSPAQRADFGGSDLFFGLQTRRTGGVVRGYRRETTAGRSRGEHPFRIAAPRSGAKSRTGPAPPPRCGVFSVSRHRAQKPQETETPHPAHNTHKGQLMLAEQPSPNSPEPRARNKSQPQRASDRSSPDIGDEPTRKMKVTSNETRRGRRAEAGARRLSREAPNTGPGRAGA